MTPEEKALGFPRSTLATHTENRAMRDLMPDLKSGDTVRIKGEYPACPSCKGAMNRLHEKTGTRIIYVAPATKPWEAGKSKKELVKHLAQLKKTTNTSTWKMLRNNMIRNFLWKLFQEIHIIK